MRGVRVRIHACERVELSQRLAKIHEQVSAVISRFEPVCLGIETVWFGQNITAAFATGQARGAALVACAQHGLSVGEFTPRQIKMAVVGTGSADKAQVQYMVKKLLNLQVEPKPDHASDALGGGDLLYHSRRVRGSRRRRCAGEA